MGKPQFAIKTLFAVMVIVSIFLTTYRVGGWPMKVWRFPAQDSDAALVSSRADSMTTSDSPTTFVGGSIVCEFIVPTFSPLAFLVDFQAMGILIGSIAALALFKRAPP